MRSRAGRSLDPSRRQNLKGALVITPLVIFGLLVAALIPLLPLKLIVLIVGAIVGLLFLLLGIENLLLATVAVCLVLIGPIEYFLGIRVIWLYSGLALLVAFKSALNLVGDRRAPVAASHRGSLSAVLVLLVVFFGAQFMVTLLQRPSTNLLIVELRDSLLPWLLLLPFLAGQVSIQGCRRLWKLVVWIGFLQLPMVLIQYLLFARKRMDTTWWDAIVGTFIGNPQAGGDSGAMAMYVISVAAFLIAAWRVGSLSGRNLAVLLPLALASLFLSEVKIALVLIPLTVVALYWVDIVRRPVVGLGVLGATAILVISIHLVYGSVFYETRAGAGTTESTLDFAFNANFIKANGEMGRFAALYYWWNHGGDALGPVAYAFGNGIGASNADNLLDLGPIARRVYPLHIAATGVTKLLWDAGIVGLGSFSALLILLFVRARAMARRVESATDKSLALGFSAMLLMALAHMFYTPAVTGHTPQIYMLLVVLTGTMFAMDRLTGKASATVPSPPARCQPVLSRAW